MEKFDYCIIDDNETKLVKHRGKIISYGPTEIVFDDYKTSKTITLNPMKYGIWEITEEYHNFFLDIIKRSETNPVFSESDRNIIFSSESPHSKYHEIDGIRYLGFTEETSMDEISIRALKPAIKKAINDKLAIKIEYINTDTGLDESEKTIMCKTLDDARFKYLESIRTSHSKRDILYSWPIILAEDLPFYTYIIALCD